MIEFTKEEKSRPYSGYYMNNTTRKIPVDKNLKTIYYIYSSWSRYIMAIYADKERAEGCHDRKRGTSLFEVPVNDDHTIYAPSGITYTDIEGAKFYDAENDKPVAWDMIYF